jgi:AcrR family transcriptional regulator
MTKAIGRSGVEGTSVSRVLREAHIARGVFYREFRERDECIREALEAALEQARVRVEDACTKEEGWRKQVRAALEALLCFCEEEPDAARLCLMRWPRRWAGLARLRQEALEELAAGIAHGDTDDRSPSPIAAEAIVSGALGVIEARLDGAEQPSLQDLAGPLTSFIVLPYLGASAARAELARTPRVRTHNASLPRVPSPPVHIRVTYRTLRVLRAIVAEPGLSNSEVAERSGTPDIGQISKLLKRLANLGLIENAGGGSARGERNAWHITEDGSGLTRALGVDRR